jgi:hypothetical protein
MPLPPHGPISDSLIVILVEFVIVTQAPEGLVIFNPVITVPFCPLMVIGPEGVSAAWASFGSGSTRKDVTRGTRRLAMERTENPHEDLRGIAMKKN